MGSKLHRKNSLNEKYLKNIENFRENSRPKEGKSKIPLFADNLSNKGKSRYLEFPYLDSCLYEIITTFLNILSVYWVKLSSKMTEASS